MNIIEVKITDIKPYKKNAKKHDEKQIKNVAKSIEKFGFVQPIVLDENNEIIIGHCRFEASKILNLKTVPCVKAEDLTEEQVKELRLLDNKLNESDWDLELLAEDINDLEFDGFDIDWGLSEPLDFDEDLEVEATGVNKKLCKCPVCGHINEEKAFKCYEDTE
jgi:hypothetical protein